MHQEYYHNLMGSTDNALDNLRKRFNLVSRLRLIAALAALLFLYLGAAHQISSGYWLTGVCGAAFLLLMSAHSSVERKQRYQQARHGVLEQYLSRFSGAWKLFSQNGKSQQPVQTPQGSDLDIFGANSLYQFLCIAGSVGGKQRLADLLLQIEPDAAAISRRQEAVKELTEHQEFSVHLQTLSRQLEDALGDTNSPSPSLSFGEIKAPYPYILRLAMWVLPVTTGLLLILSLLGIQKSFTAPAATVAILLQLLLAFGGHAYNTSRLATLFSFQRQILPFREIFSALETQELRSPLLAELQREISGEGGAAQALRHLHRIGEAAKMRLGFLTYLLCGGLFMWDYHCVDLLASWQKTYGGEIQSWLDCVSELEALLSLSILNNVREKTCFPVITTGSQPQIHFSALTHPLLPEQAAVENSLTLDAKPCIITGSNMSGKTTFLRSIGINLFLAYAGAPVCAAEFSAPCLRIFTSMRVHDDVSQGISTFYAELLRIKEMVEYKKRQLPMLCLIDEIFKGTNSADRITGARETIRQLAVPWCLPLITTHDFELCALEEDAKVNAVNFHFTETYHQNQILFDYHIRPGRCQTTNARYLLQIAGIIPTESME